MQRSEMQFLLRIGRRERSRKAGPYRIERCFRSDRLDLNPEAWRGAQAEARRRAVVFHIYGRRANE
jgi:hypothetical protein